MLLRLRKVWESMSTNHADNNHHHHHHHLPRSRSTSTSTSTSRRMGALEDLPEEIMGIIMRKVGPKEAAKLCLVCSSFRRLVSSDFRLWIHFFQIHESESESESEPSSSGYSSSSSIDDWESVFFAETHLRCGPPLNLNLNLNLNLIQSDNSISTEAPMSSLMLMNIYGLRAEAPGALLVDGGSGYCKFGWSKYPQPSGRSATFLEFGNIEAPMYSRLRHFYATICTRMHVKPSSHPIVVSIPICHCDDTESAEASRRQLKQAIYSALFDMNAPAACAINQATLALYAARRTSGIVVNIGFHQTSVVPILQGKIMWKVGVEVVGIGALKLTGFLRERMQQRNINFESLYTVRELKENLCYVAYVYEAELLKDTQASYEISREGIFTLSKERFQTGEILFQPRIGGVRAMGLHQAVALCMDHCDDAELMGDDSWFKTVVLCGGTACLRGLPERLEKELREFLPTHMSDGVRVIPPPYGADSAWHGARLISSLSTFPGSWCMTKKQFRYKTRRNRLGLR